MHRVDAWRMVQRRAADLGTRVRIGCHTFRATGITAYSEAGGTLENAQAMEPVAKLFRIPLKSRQCIWNQTYCFQVQCYKIFRFPLDLVTVLFRFDHPDSQQQA
jgi:hypothetical protein